MQKHSLLRPITMLKQYTVNALLKMKNFNELCFDQKIVVDCGHLHNVSDQVTFFQLGLLN